MQIRYGGCKGVISVNPDLDGADHQLRIRKSMKKFKCDHDILELCRISKPRKSIIGYLFVISHFSCRSVVLESTNYCSLVSSIDWWSNISSSAKQTSTISCRVACLSWKGSGIAIREAKSKTISITSTDWWSTFEFDCRAILSSTSDHGWQIRISANERTNTVKITEEFCEKYDWYCRWVWNSRVRAR